jgi:amylosucrase
VLNHVADDHPWAQGAAAGDPQLRDYFHVLPDEAQVAQWEAALGQVFPEAAPGNFTRVEAMGGWVWTTFYPYQWDLNYANPQVFAAMLGVLLRLANRGVEVFRLDSTAFLWKRAGTTCMNQPETHAILQALRALVDIAAPGVLLKAEAIVPTAELPAYFGSAGVPECHLAYHSSLMAAGWAALAEQDAALPRAVIEATPPLPPAASWLTYVRCHDDIGWNVLRGEAPDLARRAAIAGFFSGPGFAAGVPFQDGAAVPVYATNGTAASLAGLERARTGEEREHAVRRLLLVHGLAMSFGGIPVLYMGDELGMLNIHDYCYDPARAHDTRWVQRAWFDEARHARRHDMDSDAGRVFQGLRALVAQRRRQDDLAAGAPCRVLPAEQPALLALLRGERFLNLSNFSGQPLTVRLARLDAGDWPEAGEEIELGPWQMRWLERDGKVSGDNGKAG